MIAGPLSSGHPRPGYHVVHAMSKQGVPVSAVWAGGICGLRKARQAVDLVSVRQLSEDGSNSLFSYQVIHIVKYALHPALQSARTTTVSTIAPSPCETIRASPRPPDERVGLACKTVSCSPVLGGSKAFNQRRSIWRAVPPSPLSATRREPSGKVCVPGTLHCCGAARRCGTTLVPLQSLQGVAPRWTQAQFAL